MSQVALITGCSSGFGLLTAVELARRGFRVFATMRDLSRASRLDQELQRAGATAAKLQLDVTDSDNVASTVDQVTREAGAVDVLVNNAGFGIAGAVEDLTLDELRDQFETNFFGMVALTKQVLPSMRERRRGHIINVSSINGRLALPLLSAYCASKYAVEGFSEAMRLELRPYNVFVSLIEPGTFSTDIFGRNARMAARSRHLDSPYYDVTERAEAVTLEYVRRSSADPAAVARRIAQVAITRRPALRYIVGSDARAMSAACRLLPYAVIETALRRLFR